MMKKQMLLWLVLVLAALPSAAFGGQDHDADRARAMVDQGLAHVAEVGAERAARDFMAPDGGFMDGEYYLLFYQYDGTCLALGAKPEIAGQNRWNVHDPDGVYQIREMVGLARQGGGWVRYSYQNPVTGELEPKSTWVRPVPGMDAFIGCGVYGEVR